MAENVKQLCTGKDVNEYLKKKSAQEMYQELHEFIREIRGLTQCMENLIYEHKELVVLSNIGIYCKVTCTTDMTPDGMLEEVSLGFQTSQKEKKDAE